MDVVEFVPHIKGKRGKTLRFLFVECINIQLHPCKERIMYSSLEGVICYPKILCMFPVILGNQVCFKNKKRLDY